MTAPTREECQEKAAAALDQARLEVNDAAVQALVKVAETWLKIADSVKPQPEARTGPFPQGARR